MSAAILRGEQFSLEKKGLKKGHLVSFIAIVTLDEFLPMRRLLHTISFRPNQEGNADV